MTQATKRPRKLNPASMANLTQPLPEGFVSVITRIQCRTHIAKWFNTRTPKERGNIITRANQLNISGKTL